MFKILCWILLLILMIPILLFFIALIVAENKMTKRPLKQFYKERASQDDFCELSKINPRFIEILLAAEDDSFYKHIGIRFDRMYAALLYDIKMREILKGGSTITQQLIKNIYFRFDSPVKRKLPEILMALKAEKILTKDEILELYINIIYWGGGRYGITDASLVYFAKNPEELTINQIFLMTSIICNPTYFNPILHPEIYIKHQKQFLKQQIKKNILSEDEFNMISEYLEGEIDPNLQKEIIYINEYGKDTEINERFGPNTFYL